MRWLKTMNKYLKADCVFVYLTKKGVLTCDDNWNKKRQSAPYNVRCFLTSNALTSSRYFTILIKNSIPLLAINSVESLLSIIPKEQRLFVKEVLEECLIK